MQSHGARWIAPGGGNGCAGQMGNESGPEVLRWAQMHAASDHKSILSQSKIWMGRARLG
jgi:hypothetical protein